jgi:hypothetical protein
LPCPPPCSPCDPCNSVSIDNSRSFIPEVHFEFSSRKIPTFSEAAILKTEKSDAQIFKFPGL